MNNTAGAMQPGGEQVCSGGRGLLVLTLCEDGNRLHRGCRCMVGCGCRTAVHGAWGRCGTAIC